MSVVSPLTVQPDRVRRPASPAAEARGSRSILCTDCDRAAEADHRIANHLALLSAYVTTRSKSLLNDPSDLTHDGVKLALDSLTSQIDAISRLHRALATRGQDLDFAVGEFLHQACEPFTSGLSGRVVLTEDFDRGCRVRADRILPVTQIASELISNAIKHSHPNGEAGNIWIRCQSVSPGTVEVRVEDDGPGLPKLFDPVASSGLGFRLIRGLAAQIGADFGFDTSPSGSRFWLRLDAAAPRDGGLIPAR